MFQLTHGSLVVWYAEGATALTAARFNPRSSIGLARDGQHGLERRRLGRSDLQQQRGHVAHPGVQGRKRTVSAQADVGVARLNEWAVALSEALRTGL